MANIRILIADDATLIRHLLATELANEPEFEVAGQACDGREAVELALRLRPDVIVMDLDMPHLNGLQAVERIIAHYPHVSVVLLTSHEGLASIGRFSGISECMSKKCTPSELFSAIRRAYQSRRQKSGTPRSNQNYQAAISLLAARSGLTERERTVIEKALDTELTVEQIAGVLTTEQKTTVTISAVKHALDRAITKLRIEPRTRAALVKYILEFDPKAVRDAVEG